MPLCGVPFRSRNNKTWLRLFIKKTNPFWTGARRTQSAPVLTLTLNTQKFSLIWVEAKIYTARNWYDMSLFIKFDVTRATIIILADSLFTFLIFPVLNGNV